jgi:hypothetical protein
MFVQRLLKRVLNSQTFVQIFYFVQWPTNAQSIDKLLYCSYMFRHYCVILRELAVSTLLRYKSMSNAVVGNTI